MIIERENEIKNFKPEEYWSITANFEKDKEVFEGTFYGVNGKKTKLNTEEDVKKILNQLTKQFTVDKVNKRERRRNPAKALRHLHYNKKLPVN